MPIEKIGGYFQKDSEGFLINPTKWDLVLPKYQEILKKLIKKIVVQKSDEIHSIYLRGSLPRGIEEKYISDIDLLMLSNLSGLKWQERKWSSDLISEFKKSENVDIEIEFFETSYDSNLIENYPQLAAILKTQSLCIFGEDFSVQLPKFKPDENLMLHHRWLEKDLLELKKNTSNIYAKKTFLKTMIRAGFELVMKRENEFTPDLYWCFKGFSKYYPKKKSQMRQALFFYPNFEENLAEIDSFIHDFGDWLVKETLKTDL